MVAFVVHNFVYSTKFNNGNMSEKSVYIYLAVLVGVPCPLEITLQCSADKKVWEPLP